MTSANVMQMPIPKLKAKAKELGVDPALPLPKLRKEVKAAMEKEKPNGKPSKPAAKPAKPEPKKLGRPAKAQAAEEEEAPAIDDSLEKLEARMTALEEQVASLKEQIEGSGEEAETEEEEALELDEEESSGDEEEEIPESVKPYVEKQDDGSYRMSLDPSDVDAMDEDTLRDVLTVLGQDVSKVKGPRKLQAKLREMLEEQAVDVDDETETEVKTTTADQLDRALNVGERVSFQDGEGATFAAQIADPDVDSWPDEEGWARVKQLDEEEAEEPWFMDVELSSLTVEIE